MLYAVYLEVKTPKREKYNLIFEKMVFVFHKYECFNKIDTKSKTVLLI